MESLRNFLNENIGIIGTAFGLLLTTLVVVVPAVFGAKGKDLQLKLEIKDATIENLRMQLQYVNMKLAETDGYKKRADDEQENNQAVIRGLQRRISELEANQYLYKNENDDIVLKD